MENHSIVSGSGVDGTSHGLLAKVWVALLGVIAVSALVALALVAFDADESDDKLAESDVVADEIDLVELLGSAGYDLGTGIDSELIPLVGGNDSSGPIIDESSDANPFSRR